MQGNLYRILTRKTTGGAPEPIRGIPGCTPGVRRQQKNRLLQVRRRLCLPSYRFINKGQAHARVYAIHVDIYIYIYMCVYDVHIATYVCSRAVSSFVHRTHTYIYIYIRIMCIYVCMCAFVKNACFCYHRWTPGYTPYTNMHVYMYTIDVCIYVDATLR